MLVKKPDDAPEISVPTAAPTQPSKPEVYFIRYKTQKKGTISGDISETESNTAAVDSSVSTASSNTSITRGRLSTNYGPPGQSGPY